MGFKKFSIFLEEKKKEEKSKSSYYVFGGFYPTEESTELLLGEATETDSANEEASFRRLPILFGKPVIKMLAQIPYPLWTNALQWIFNEGLAEAAVHRYHGGSYNLHGEIKKNKEGNVPSNIDLSMDMVGGRGKQMKYVFKNFNSHMGELLDELEKPFSISDASALLTMNDLDQAKEYSKDLGHGFMLHPDNHKLIDDEEGGKRLILDNYMGISKRNAKAVIAEWMKVSPTGLIGTPQNYFRTLLPSAGGNPEKTKNDYIIAHNGSIWSFYNGKRPIAARDSSSIKQLLGDKSNVKITNDYDDDLETNHEKHLQVFEYEINGEKKQALHPIPVVMEGKAVDQKSGQLYKNLRDQFIADHLSDVITGSNIQRPFMDKEYLSSVLSGKRMEEIDRYTSVLTKFNPTHGQSEVELPEGGKAVINVRNYDLNEIIAIKHSGSDRVAASREAGLSQPSTTSFGAFSPQSNAKESQPITNKVLKDLGLSKNQYFDLMDKHFGTYGDSNYSNKLKEINYKIKIGDSSYKSPISGLQVQSYNDSEVPNPVVTGIYAGIRIVKGMISHERHIEALIENAPILFRDASVYIKAENSGQAVIVSFIMELLKKEKGEDYSGTQLALLYDQASKEVKRLAANYTQNVGQIDLGYGTRSQLRKQRSRSGLDAGDISDAESFISSEKQADEFGKKLTIPAGRKKSAELHSGGEIKPGELSIKWKYNPRNIAKEVASALGAIQKEREKVSSDLKDRKKSETGEKDMEKVSKERWNRMSELFRSEITSLKDLEVAVLVQMAKPFVDAGKDFNLHELKKNAKKSIVDLLSAEGFKLSTIDLSAESQGDEAIGEDKAAKASIIKMARSIPSIKPDIDRDIESEEDLDARLDREMGTQREIPSHYSDQLVSALSSRNQLAVDKLIKNPTISKTITRELSLNKENMNKVMLLKSNMKDQSELNRIIRDAEAAKRGNIA